MHYVIYPSAQHRADDLGGVATSPADVVADVAARTGRPEGTVTALLTWRYMRPLADGRRSIFIAGRGRLPGCVVVSVPGHPA